MRVRLSGKILQLITVLLISIYTPTCSGVTGEILPAQVGFRGMLAPQLRFKPICDDDIGDAHILESFILFRLKKYPGLLDMDLDVDLQSDLDVDLDMGRKKEMDVYSRLSNRDIIARFSKSLSRNIDQGLSEKDLEKVIMVPCLVNYREFIASILLFSNGSVSVKTRRVFDGAYEKDFLEGTLISSIEHGLENSVPDYAAVDISDASVAAVISFLEAVDIYRLKDMFVDMVTTGRVFVSSGSVFVRDGITFNDSMSREERSLNMLEQLLMMSNVGGFRFVREGVLSAFSQYMCDSEGFDAKAFWSKYGMMLSVIENGLANEGGISFSRSAYESTIDTDFVKYSDCEEAGIMRDITTALVIIMHNEMNEYNRTKGDKVKAFPYEHFDIKYDQLSKYVFPTLVVKRPDGVERRKGQIIVNENFIKALYLLRYLRGKEGDVFSLPEYEFEFEGEDNDGLFDPEEDRIRTKQCKESERIGNLYDSILYSTMLFALRGCMRFDNGVIVYSDDQERAQGERGRERRYMNVLAMVYFWLTVVENIDMINTDYVSTFLREHEQLTRGLSKKEIDTLPVHLMDIILGIREKFRESDIPLPGLPRVLMSAPTPGAVYGMIKHRSCTVSRKDIVTEFRSKDENMVSQSLEVLQKTGLIKVVFTRSSGKIAGEERFMVIPLNERQREDIQSLLEEYDRDPGGIDIASLRAEVLRITDTVWAHEFLKASVDCGLARDAIAEGKEIILAVETDWVPGCQRDFIQGLIQQLDKIDHITVIRGSADELAGELNKRVDGVWTPWDNVVVLAGEDTLKSRDFVNIRKYHDVQKKGFFVGIDPRELSSYSYIRIMQMLSMAVRMSRGYSLSTFDHPNINVVKVDERTYIFIPQTEPLDLTLMKLIYDAQKKILEAA